MQRRAIAVLSQLKMSAKLDRTEAAPIKMGPGTGVYIVGASRTPIGSFNGSLASVPAPTLGSLAIQGACNQVNEFKNGSLVPTECIMGNVLSAGLGQAPARQAALQANLPYSTICTTVNKVCSSGMKAVHFATQSIMLGLHSSVVAGGMESMSNAPYLMESGARNGGFGYGHQQLVDSIIKDGLWDSKYQIHMGECTERVAEKHGLGRPEQDTYAIESYKRANKATDDGSFRNEIVPVKIEARKKGQEPVVIVEDEEVRRVDYTKIPKLRTAFRNENGTITAANSSSMSDGASALLLVSDKLLKEHNIPPLAQIISYSDAEVDPCDFPLAPTKAIPLALERAGLEIKDIALFEINEAFSAVILANQKVPPLT